MRKMRFLLLIITAPIIFSGCMSSAYVNVLKPADITIPRHIEKIAVANRSLSSKENKVWNVVEGVLSGEGLFMDREGSEGCIAGVTNVLAQSPRFDVIQPANLELKGTGTGSFPSPLDWREISKICQENQADALLLLEVFDSDARTAFAGREKKVKKGDKTVTVTEQVADLKMEIKSGWRLYDPEEKRIVDKFEASDFQSFEGVGATDKEAEKNLPHKRDAVNKTGVYAGNQYAFRISPQWIKVKRSFYTGGSDAMKRATRKARSNDWIEAAAIWKKVAQTAEKRKVAGRAAYNMALASEIEGKLDIALDWAKKAYQDFNIKSARNYTRLLERRIRDQQKLDEQI